MIYSPFEGGEFLVTDIIRYRTHPVTGQEMTPHYGMDIVGRSSDRITAVRPGRVVSSTIVYGRSNATWQWGNYVKVTGATGISIYYCHMSKRAAAVGQIVKIGDFLGIMGNTGQTTGPHLHIEARRGYTKAQIPANPGDECNIAKIMGIQNRTGIYKALPAAPPAPEECARLVAEKAGLSKAAVSFLNRYKYREPLWISLWDAMKGFPKRETGSFGKDYATAVARAADLEGQTVKYIWGAPGAEDLWRQLWWQMT